MSIRSEAMATRYRGELSYQLQDILHRNGMRAQVALVEDKYVLIVQGHDSPVLEYPITERQFQALSDGGSNYSNKKAYNTFNSIVCKDFDVPSSFVAARNVNGLVAMGLHGYRETYPGNSTLSPPRAIPPGYLGMRPSMQPGFHLRRVGGTVMVPEHFDGRIRPGELKSGAYGYYYKGSQKPSVQRDPLEDLQEIFPEVKATPRPTEPAKPYKELITSPVYFSNEKWQEILSSHGIIIDESKKSMTVLSKGTTQDFEYNLSEEDFKKLTDNSLKSTPINERLDIINSYIGNDFNEKVTMNMLNSKESISITVKPIPSSIETQQAESLYTNNDATLKEEVVAEARMAPTTNPEEGYVNGQNLQALNESKGWYREGKHGREVEVGDIWVEKIKSLTNEQTALTSKASSDEQKGKQKEKDSEVTYKMSAVINGTVVSHEISKRQYDKFMAVDDYQRQRMMSKVFSEVDMKTRPEMREKFNLGAFLAAGLTALSEATYLGADIAHNISHIKNPHPRPEIYHETHKSDFVYFKPGLERPEDLAKRAYDAGVNATLNNLDMNRGR